MFDETLLRQMFSLYLQESLTARGWTLENLKNSCSLSSRKANALIQGNSPFCPEIVRELEVSLGWTPERIEKIYQTAGISYLAQLKDELEEWNDFSSAE